MERCILRHKCLGIDKPKQNGAKRSSFSLFNRRPKIYLSADESGSSSKGSSRDDGDAGGGSMVKWRGASNVHGHSPLIA